MTLHGQSPNCRLSNRRTARLRRLLLSSTVLGSAVSAALLLVITDSHAVCAPPAGGAGVPPPGTTVTCSGLTVDQNLLNGYGDGFQDALTIHVEPLATVQGTLNGFFLGNNNTIDNGGTILGAGGDGIRTAGNVTVDNAAGQNITGTLNGILSLGAGVNVTNGSGSLIQGNIAGVSAATDATVVNFGTITGLLSAIQAAGAADVTNNTGGNVTGNTLFGIVAGTDATVVNSGTITGQQTAIQAGAAADVTNNTGGIITATIAFGIEAGTEATVVNSGTITGGFDAIRAGTTANVINNTGSNITGTNLFGIVAGTDATVVNSGTISGLIRAIQADGAANVINNTGGTITGTSEFGIFAGTDATVVNSGTIAGPVAIRAGGAANVTNNTGGTIIGAVAINAVGGGSNVFNAGTLTGSGGNAIVFGGTGNTVALGPGFAINGLVQGTGADTFQLGGVGSDSFDAALIGTQYLGFAAFDKIEASNWTLSGTNAAVLPWTVQQGTLNVTGTLANSPFTIADGMLLVNGTVGDVTLNNGLFGGAGTVASLTANGGIVAPGNGIGTINVVGNVSLAGDATYEVEINAAGQADRIAAGGTATLNGGTVQPILLSPLASFGPSTTYTILSAAGGVTDTFADLNDDLLFWDFSLGYTPTEVLLTLARVPFSSVAQTSNQINVANALDIGGGALALAILNLTTPADARGAFDALSGEIHASLQTSLAEDSRFIRNAVLDRLRGASYAGDVAMASLATGGPLFAFAAQVEGAATLAYPKSGMPTKAPPPAPVAHGPDVVMWNHAFGAWGAWDSDGDAARVSRDLAGFVAGIDTRFGDQWRGGVAAGYSQSDVRVPARASAADIQSYHVAGYLGARYGEWGLRGGASYAWHNIDTFRSIVFPGFGETALAAYDANTAQVFGEVGYAMTFGRTAVEPFAGLAWVNVDMGDFVETGGLAALVGAGDGRDIGYSTVGVRAASAIPWASGTVLVPRVTAAWQHALNNIMPEAVLAFQATGAAFTVTGVPIARDSALFEATLDLVINRNTTIGVSYVGQLAEDAQDHGLKGKALWRF